LLLLVFVSLLLLLLGVLLQWGWWQAPNRLHLRRSKPCG
jgi:hypothetical protein